MLTTIHIKGFRCFEDTKFSGLKRVNLFGGHNGIGKTTLLEAIFILAGGAQPALAPKLSIFRGITEFPLTANGIWGDWFHSVPAIDAVTLEANTDELQDGNLIEVCLTITRKLSQTVEFDPAHPGEPDHQGWYPQYELVKGGKRTSVSGKLRTTGEKAFFEQGENTLVWPGIFLHTGEVSVAEDADRYSALDRKNDKACLERLVKALQILCPGIGRIAVNTVGEAKLLVAEPQPGHPLLPLGVLGNGLRRLCSVILAIESVPNGVVIVDEIENGFHHEVLPKIWQALAESATAVNVQIFATTHSLECIKSAVQTVDQKMLNYCRLQMVGDKIQVVSYPPDVALSAVETETEMR